MPQTITKGFRAMLEEAEREIETLTRRGRAQAPWPR